MVFSIFSKTHAVEAAGNVVCSFSSAGWVLQGRHMGFLKSWFFGAGAILLHSRFYCPREMGIMASRAGASLSPLQNQCTRPLCWDRF